MYYKICVLSWGILLTNFSRLCALHIKHVRHGQLLQTASTGCTSKHKLVKRIDQIWVKLFNTIFQGLETLPFESTKKNRFINHVVCNTHTKWMPDVCCQGLGGSGMCDSEVIYGHSSVILCTGHHNITKNYYNYNKIS